MNSGRRVLVTGASGFVGSHAAEELVRRGWQVRVLVRATSSRRWLGEHPYEFSVADVRSESELASACRGCDAVLHAAGVTNARRTEEYYEVNAQGTARLWRAARREGVRRFLLVSSLAAGGPSRPGTLRDETTPPEPVSAYGRSKLAAERILLEEGDGAAPEAVIVRPPAVYGPRDPDVLTLVRLSQRGLFPLAFGGRRVSMVHATDLAAGMRLALEEGAPARVYYLTDGKTHALPEVAVVMGRVLGRRVRTFPVPRLAWWLVALGGEVWNRLRSTPAALNLDRARQFAVGDWAASDQRARAELGYRSEFDLERGLRETIEWYRRIGWI